MTEREQLRLDIKRRLNSYRDMDAERRQLQAQLLRVEMLMDAPGGSNWDGMPHGTGVSNPVEKMVTKKLTLENRYRTKLAELVEAQEAIEALIEVLEPTERCLARYRYLDGLRWEDVCVRINYSWMQTHRIHAKLLDKLVEIEMAKRNK
jgi:hypothetical protein